MTAVRLARSQKRIRLRPMLVWGIGEFLRFEADGGALAIDHSTLSDYRAVEEIAGIDLHSRFGGVNL